METEEIAKLADRSLSKIVYKIKDQAGVERPGFETADLSNAVFLFHYSQHFVDAKSDMLAGKILEEIYPKTNKIADYSFRNGIAGVGCCIEYLVQQRLVIADTDDILKDVDFILGELLLNSFLKNTDLNLGTLAIGRYFVSRLQNPLSTKRAFVLKVLQNVVDQLDSPYNTYNEIEGVINFLSFCVLENIDRIKADTYLKYSIDKLETMLREDIYFKKIPLTFHSHRIILFLYNASCNSTDNCFLERIKILHDLLITRLPVEDGSYTTLLRFMVHSDVFKLYYPQDFIEHQYNRLINLLNDEDILMNVLSSEKDEHLSFFNKYTAAGMCLLYLSGKIGKEWQERFNYY